MSEGATSTALPLSPEELAELRDPFDKDPWYVAMDYVSVGKTQRLLATIDALQEERDAMAAKLDAISGMVPEIQALQQERDDAVARATAVEAANTALVGELRAFCEVRKRDMFWPGAVCLILDRAAIKPTRNEDTSEREQV
jgi:hypothetical protein